MKTAIQARSATLAVKKTREAEEKRRTSQYVENYLGTAISVLKRRINTAIRKERRKISIRFSAGDNDKALMLAVGKFMKSKGYGFSHKEYVYKADGSGRLCGYTVTITW